MHRGRWIALVGVSLVGIAGALVLGRALERQTEKATTSTQTLAPHGARIVSRATLPATATVPSQTVVVWARPLADDPAVKRFGVRLWQGRTIVYEHRSPVNTESAEFEAGDFTGDGHDDLLVFDNTDGSGGCGVYRALATSPGSVRQVSLRLLCEDQGSIHLQRQGLVFRMGEQRDPATAQQTHCCYRFVRTTVRRWNGSELVAVRSSRKPLPKFFAWPPGDTPPGELRYCTRPGGPGNYLASSWSVPCRLARRVERGMMSRRCSSRGRCTAAGFSCVTYWNHRYGQPFVEVHHAICHSGDRRVEMDEG
jgi:hypothetical protein